MSDSEVKKPSAVISILRWVALIPAVIVASFVVNFVLEVALEVNLITNDPMSGYGPRYGWSKISIAWKVFVTSLVYGATFPAVASAIAPSIKKVVAVTTCGFVLTGGIVFVLPQYNWITLVFFFGMNAGAIGVTAYAWREDLI